MGAGKIKVCKEARLQDNEMSGRARKAKEVWFMKQQSGKKSSAIMNQGAALFLASAFLVFFICANQKQERRPSFASFSAGTDF